MSFDHRKIEKKWQKYWEDNQTFKTNLYDFSKNLFSIGYDDREKKLIDS